MAAARRDPPVPEYRQSAQDGGSVVKAKSSRRLRKDATREEDLWNPSEIVDATSFLSSYIITSLTEWMEKQTRGRRAP